MTEKKRNSASFILLAYNQEKYISAAVYAALNQTHKPLQIIFSDDASTDKTYEILSEIVSNYYGPHEIIVNRNENNLGIGGNLNKAMELTTGEFVVVAAGDDISDSNRVEIIVEAFLRSDKKIYSIWTCARYIDADGRQVARKFPSHVMEVTDKTIIRNKTTLIGATHAWRRDVFDFFGPLMNDVCFEDNAISFRSHLLGGVVYLDRELVSYRTHDGNLCNFTKIEDLSILYRAAEKRCFWMLIAFSQRKKDLEFARSHMPVFHRNYEFLSNELLKMEGLFRRRLMAYHEFPRLSFHAVMAAFRDIEIVKVLLRSLKHKFYKS